MKNNILKLEPYVEKSKSTWLSTTIFNNTNVTFTMETNGTITCYYNTSVVSAGNITVTYNICDYNG